MVEGKIERRLWQIWTYDGRLSEENAEKLQDETNFNVRAVLKVINEALKEFPLKIYGDTLVIDTRQEQLLQTVQQIKDWRTEWFRKV